jgi:hypothetical protein
MTYRDDFATDSPYSYSHCTYLIVSSEEYFRVNPQSEFPADFFDANQRFSVDNTKIFIKCNGIFPTNVSSLYSTKEGPYSFSEMLQIINSPEWTS